MNATTAIDTATVAPPSTHIGPALLCDAARVLHQLGLKSVRGAVVDMPSGAFHPGWSMIDSSVQGNGLDYALAGLRLIGASSMLRQLDEASDDSATVFLRHSPRHWSFGWRIDDTRAVVAEARYHDARAMLCEIDTALVRLLCDTGMLARQVSAAQPDAADGPSPAALPVMALPVPVVAPVQSRRARSAAMALAGLAAAALVVALSVWPNGFAKATARFLPGVSSTTNR